MTNYPTRPDIHQHTVDCVSKATICAIENIRDHCKEHGEAGSTMFYSSMQDNDAWHDGLMYLETGTTICYCPPCKNSCCENLTGEGENIRFKEDPDDGEYDQDMADFHPWNA